MNATVLAVEFQANWLEVLQTSFMRNALVGGSLVAVAAGLLGYFVITRQNAFAAHALAHIGFPGATGAILLGVLLTLGLAVFCVGGGLLIGLLGRRVADREIATGTILALSRALGEAAPLLLLGAVVFIRFDPDGLFSGFTTLPIQIFNWAGRPQAEFQEVAAAAIIVLLGLLLLMNAVAIMIRNRYQKRW